MVTHVAANKIQAALREVRSMTAHASARRAPATNPQKPQATVTVLSPGRPEAIPRVDSHELQAAVADIAKNVRNVQRSLQFSVDQSSGRTVITVVDKAADEVIRQIPPEEILAIADRIQNVAGLFVADTA